MLTGEVNNFFYRCKAILTEYETKHNAPVAVDDDTVSLINVETKLQSIFNEQKTKFAKVTNTSAVSALAGQLCL